MAINTKYDVCIIGGLGHVGLPLGLSLADSGKRVVLYDINRKWIDMVSAGQMPFIEEGAPEVLKRVIGKNLFVSGDKGSISESRYVVVIIGTPVDEHLNPKFSLFKNFFADILDYLKDGQHILLRSTIYPGTTEKLKQYLEKNGKQLKLSFCPERIAQGKAVEELRSLPQIVSAFDEESFREAEDLFSVLTKTIIRLTPTEAEFAKLFTNSWRYIQFAIANQFYQMATEQGLDFYRIYDAITYKYPRAANFPRAGFAAGPCLFKDTMQLAARSNNSFFLGHSAMLVNEGLPNFIVQRLKEKYSIKDKVVGILGMTFKADNDDIRESLSFKLKKLLQIEARKVLFSDPYLKAADCAPAVPDDERPVGMQELIDGSDLIVLATIHKEYKNIDTKGKPVVDIWNYHGHGGLF